MENQLKMIVIAALALSAAFAAPARVHAEPGRCDALRLLIEQLPDANPHEDPGYLDGVSGYLLPQQLTSCHWKPEEMAAIERILALFDKDRTADGCDSQALIADLGRLPDFADRERSPQAKSEFNSLVMGIRLAPDMTKVGLVAADCREMLKMNFSNGADRDVLMKALTANRSAIDSAAPR